MVKLTIEGNEFDILNDKITYVKQVNEFGDLSKQNSSYTWSFEIPKTFKNTQWLNGLGMIGSESKYPYNLNNASIYENGIAILNNGIAEIQATKEKSYEINIKEGIVTLQKLIEDKNIKDDLNLDVAIRKTKENIISTWTEEHPKIKFLVADYGISKFKRPDESLSSIFFVPFIQLKYIWDKIFEDIGYVYKGNFDGFEDWYLSYPSPANEEEAGNLPEKGELKFEGKTNDLYVNSNWYWKDIERSDKIKGTGNFLGVEVIEGGVITMELMNFNGGTELVIEVDRNGVIRPEHRSINAIVVTVNGVDYFFGDDSNVPQIKDHLEINLNEFESEEKFEIEVRPLTLSELMNLSPLYPPDTKPVSLIKSDFLIGTNFKAEFYWREIQDFEFGNVFKEFSYKDIIKEVMIRFGHTAFVDNEKREINFVDSNSRLKIQKNNIRKLDKILADRKKESYILGDYAQKNTLKDKGLKIDVDYIDEASFKISNKNLKEKKDFFASKFNGKAEYKRQYLKSWGIDEYMDFLPSWDKEVNEDSNGNLEIKYKPFDNQYFLTEQREVNKSIKVDDLSYYKFYAARKTNIMWKEIVKDYYSIIRNSLDNYRMQTVELDVNAFSFSNISLRDIYYSEKEKSFFIFNKIEYKTGEKAKAELIKIKP